MLTPSVRVMLSANVSGDAKARHHIRHRARHGLAPSLKSYGGTRRGGVASPLQRFAPVVPCRRPRRPRRSRASHAAHAPRQRLTQAGCRVSPDSDEVGTFVVSRRARPLVIFSVPPIFKHHPDTISRSRQRAQHDGAKRQSSNPLPQGHRKQTHRLNRSHD
jgi:hypothetical protein